MRIEVAGFAGAGKSTLARALGKIYGLKVLHIDTLHFDPDWVIRDGSLMDADIKAFLNENDSWIIDGNYYRHIPERFDLADYVIYLDFNRFTCFRRVMKRTKDNKDVQREDMAAGCIDKPSLSFYLWVLFGSRSHKIIQRFNRIMEKQPEKLIVLKNQKQVDAFLRRLEKHEPIGKN